MVAMPGLMLLDTPSLYYRAFYGIPESVTAPDGTPVNAVRGLIDMIAMLVRQHAPGELAACMDADWRPAFRVRGEVGGQGAAVLTSDRQLDRPLRRLGQVGGHGQEREPLRAGSPVEQLVGLRTHDPAPVGGQFGVDPFTRLGQVVGQVRDVVLHAVAAREEVGRVEVVDDVPVGVQVEARPRALSVEGGDDVVLVGDAGDPDTWVGGPFEVDGRADGHDVGDGVAGAEHGVLDEVHDGRAARAVPDERQFLTAWHAVVLHGPDQGPAVGTAVEYGAAEGAEQVLRRVVVRQPKTHARRLDDVAHHPLVVLDALDEHPARRAEQADVAQEAEQRAPLAQPYGLDVDQVDAAGGPLTGVEDRHGPVADTGDRVGGREAPSRRDQPGGLVVERVLVQQGPQGEHLTEDRRECAERAHRATVLEQGPQRAHRL
ncbi:hypothetical protein ACFQ08_26085, partial [Streptosporangium algeriense]